MLRTTVRTVETALAPAVFMRLESLHAPGPWFLLRSCSCLPVKLKVGLDRLFERSISSASQSCQDSRASCPRARDTLLVPGARMKRFRARREIVLASSVLWAETSHKHRTHSDKSVEHNCDRGVPSMLAASTTTGCNSCSIGKCLRPHHEP